MPEEELFLYLRDKGTIDWSFRRLVEDQAWYKKTLEELQSTGTDEKEDRYLRAAEGLERVTAGMRKEAERVMKVWAFQALNLDRAWRKAEKQIEEQEQREQEQRNATGI